MSDAAVERMGTLGPYEISESVGHGGMGMVLRGHDPRLNRVVAIKVLMPALAMNPTAHKRFLREAQAAAAVNHPHVVTIHAIGEAEGIPYLGRRLAEVQLPTGQSWPAAARPAPPISATATPRGISPALIGLAVGCALIAGLIVMGLGGLLITMVVSRAETRVGFAERVTAPRRDGPLPPLETPPIPVLPTPPAAPEAPTLDGALGSRTADRGIAPQAVGGRKLSTPRTTVRQREMGAAGCPRGANSALSRTLNPYSLRSRVRS